MPEVPFQQLDSLPTIPSDLPNYHFERRKCKSERKSG